MKPFPSALLVLEDGTMWTGRGFGAVGDSIGEIVFNTSITGYQEILTDPSYHGQIVTMTSPHIGNYGVTSEDEESPHIWTAGLVVRSVSPMFSNWRAEQSLPDYLQTHGIVGITDVDTRALVRHIRTHGAMRAALSTSNIDPERLLALARSARDMNGLDLAQEVTCVEPYQWTQGQDWWQPPGDKKAVSRLESGQKRPFHVIAFDFGIKRNILRLLASRGCHVTVVPAKTTAPEVMRLHPDGVFLSNGPGDPAAVSYAVKNVQQLLGKTPIFGICLGHQILGLALGAETYKLKFGHRGVNQPVIRLENNKVEITSQNHGFAVAAEGLPKELIVTHRNLNDNTIAGLRHVAYQAFGVQYHPEASAGPHDSQYLFDTFLQMIAENRTDTVAV